MRMKIDIEWEDPRERMDFIVRQPGSPEVELPEATRREGVEPPLLIIGPGGDFLRRYFDPGPNRPAAAGLDVRC